MVQSRYWNELQHLKENLGYIQLYRQKLESRDKALKFFLAITSSGSIAGWAIWKNVGMLWAVIIAASHVIHAIKHLFPYEARLKSLSGLFYAIEKLLLFTEERWYDVSEGNLTEKQIHDLQFEIRRKRIDTVKKHLGDTLLPLKEKLWSKSVRSADVYFDTFYKMEDKNE